MPTPRKNETQTEFVSRCIPIVRSEGRSQDQAVAMCYSMWRQHQDEQKADGDSMKLQTGYRFDFAAPPHLRVSKTDEGYLTGSAPVAKVGVMTYLLPDGSTRREFVPPETLFNADSMASLKMKPITNIHPPERTLDSRTVKRRKVGFTGENVNKEDNYLATSLVVTDSDAVQDAEGGRVQLSPGYRAELELKPGVFQGQKYDAVQVKRTYNHLALVDAARGGPDLRLRMDGDNYVDETGARLDGWEEKTDEDLPYQARKNLPDSDFAFVRGSGDNKVRKFPIHDKAHVRNALARLPQSNLSTEEKARVLAKVKRKAKDMGIEVSEDGLDPHDIDDYNLTDSERKTISKERRMDMTRVTINNLDYECAPEVKVHLDALIKERDNLKTDLDKTKADLDTANSKISDFEKVDTKAEIAKAVKARLDLERSASEHLDEEQQKTIANLDDKALKSAVILKAFPDAKDKMDNASDAYIDARFDSALEVLKKKKGDEDHKNDAMSRQREQANGKPNDQHQDSDDEPNQEKSRKDMEERMLHPERFNEDGTRKEKK